MSVLLITEKENKKKSTKQNKRPNNYKNLNDRLFQAIWGEC